MSKKELPRDEIAASLQAGRELGPDYDEAVAASLVERLDEAIDTRIREQLDRREQAAPAAPPASGPAPHTARLVLTIVAMGISIPLTAISGGLGGPMGIMAAWIGIITFYLIAVTGFRGPRKG